MVNEFAEFAPDFHEDGFSIALSVHAFRRGHA